MALAPSSHLINKLFDLYFGNLPIKPKKEVVVVGYGWAGKSFCDKINTNKYNVTVVSKTDYMLNTTKLKNLLIDKEEDDLKIKPKLENINFIKDECKDIIESQNIIKTKDKTIKFDYLIIAVGSENNDFGIKGVKEHCYFFKSIEDVNNIKKHLELNNQIVIIGGGPNGIELAFELSKKYKNIKIVEAISDILSMFSDITKLIVKKELVKSGIQLILDNQVMEIEKNMIKAKKYNVNFNTAIWTGGIKPNSLLQKITKDKFIVNKHFNYNKSNIYALGDIVAMGPPTAQNAKQQGYYLANYFNNDLQGEPYEYKENGKIIHSKDWIIIETNGYGTWRVPHFVQPIIDYYISKEG